MSINNRSHTPANKVSQDSTKMSGPHTIDLDKPLIAKNYEDIAATVFWCAYYGHKEEVEMYLNAGLSPLIKCYKKRNLLAGATMGAQTEIASLILSKTFVDKRSGKHLNELLILN